MEIGTFKLQNIERGHYTYVSPEYEVLDFVLRKDRAEVQLRFTYLDLFPQSAFYESWISESGEGSRIFLLDVEEYPSSWNLDALYFLPRIRFKDNQRFYELLSEEEQQYFRGLGARVLRLFLEFLLRIDQNVNEDTIITLGATDVINRFESEVLIALIKYYETLSFEIDYEELNRILEEKGIPRRIDNQNRDQALEIVRSVGRNLTYVPMVSLVGDVLAPCIDTIKN